MTPPAIELHFQRGAQRFGPYALEKVREFAASGQLVATDLAWHAGLNEWRPFAAVASTFSIALPPPAPGSSTTRGLEWVVPVNRSGLAIAAGYAALFSVLVFPAPLALALGIFALRDLKKHPEKLGRGRAWFGVIAGGLVTAFFAGTFLVGLLNH